MPYCKVAVPLHKQTGRSPLSRHNHFTAFTAVKVTATWSRWAAARDLLVVAVYMYMQSAS